ncbi:hypothetical protein BYT27DRAFT_7214459 [Phlegmacium glaucopus]|nr:hypothetical protein BYT27DRAFT_7214459 [Phlegmacium glaucopus]
MFNIYYHATMLRLFPPPPPLPLAPSLQPPPLTTTTPNGHENDESTMDGWNGQQQGWVATDDNNNDDGSTPLTGVYQGSIVQRKTESSEVPGTMTVALAQKPGAMFTQLLW